MEWKRIIQLDLGGDLEPSYVDYANQFLLGLNDSLTETISRSYRYHHDPLVMSLKVIWDYFHGWGVTDPKFYLGTYLDPDAHRESGAFIQLL